MAPRAFVPTSFKGRLGDVDGADLVCILVDGTQTPTRDMVTVDDITSEVAGGTDSRVAATGAVASVAQVVEASYTADLSADTDGVAEIVGWWTALGELGVTPDDEMLLVSWNPVTAGPGSDPWPLQLPVDRVFARAGEGTVGVLEVVAGEGVSVDASDPQRPTVTADAGSGASDLADLTDVDLTTPPEGGQVLTYDGEDEVWVAGTAPASVEELDDLSDVALTTPADGDVLTYNFGTSTWENAPASGGGSGDVVGPASATADSLARFDGTTGKLLKNGAVIGTDVQAYDAQLAAVAGFTNGAVEAVTASAGLWIGTKAAYDALGS